MVITRRLRRWLRWLWPLPVALACAGSPPPDPVVIAEGTCWALVIVDVVKAGRCDQYQRLDDCPAYVAAMTECAALLRVAATVPE